MKIFTTPYNIGGSDADLTLKFWYYVSNPSMLTGTNQLELGSGEHRMLMIIIGAWKG